MTPPVVLAGTLLAAAVLLWPQRRAAGPHAVGARRAAQEPAGPREVADAVELLALALGSGTSVATCLELVAQECAGEVAEHLQQVAAALRWGVDTRVAWAAVPPMWAPAGAALALAETSGTPPGEQLRAAAQRIRSSEQHRLELAGARVAVRLVLPLGLCFLPAFVLLTVVPVVAAMASALLRG